MYEPPLVIFFYFPLSPAHSKLSSFGVPMLSHASCLVPHASCLMPQGSFRPRSAPSQSSITALNFQGLISRVSSGSALQLSHEKDIVACVRIVCPFASSAPLLQIADRFAPQQVLQLPFVSEISDTALNATRRQFGTLGLSA